MSFRPRALAALVGVALLTASASASGDAQPKPSVRAKAAELLRSAATRAAAAARKSITRKPVTGQAVTGQAVTGKPVAREPVAATLPLNAVQYQKQVRRAAAELRKANHGPVVRALRSFGDPAMPAAQRRRLLGEASGAPLTDSALAMTRALVTVLPKDAFTSAGRAGVRARTRSRVENAWWSPFIPKDLEGTGRALDELTATAMRPEFRGQLDTALNVLRVAGRIEADNLAQIGVRIPPERLPELQAAVSRYATSMATEVLVASGAAETAPASDKATKQLVERLVDLAFLVPTTSGMAPAERDRVLTREVIRLRGDLIHGAEVARTAKKAFVARGGTSAVDWKRLDTRVAAHTRRLKRVVSRVAEASPEARAAAGQLGRDLELAGRFAVGMARIVGAGSNLAMAPAQRARIVKEAAESMGPIFIKMVQTIINNSGGLDELGIGDALGDDVVLMALTDLQDAVTPMSDRDVRRQIRSTLGKDVDQAFVDFEMTPFRSASIAQVHRAKVWAKPSRFGKPRLVNVAVKVQRPGLMKELGETVRASRLAIAVAREALSAFDLSKQLKGVDPATLARLLDLADTAIPDFIRSFEVETNFVIEREQMGRFERLVRAESDIFVPRAFAEYSGEKVLTMEFVRGDKLTDPARPDSKSDYKKRLTRATAARTTPARRGPLADGPAGMDDARARGADHALRTYGLEPTAVELALALDRNGGYDVNVQFDSEAQPRAAFRIARNGRITDRGVVPDLSRRGATELRDSLMGSFLNHIFVNRYVHGDIHNGNFKVLADGKTIALLDFGQVVKLSPRNLVAPAQFVLGLRQNDLGLMARAIVGMSDQRARMSKVEIKATTDTVRGVLQEIFSGASDRYDQRLLTDALVRTSVRAGLTVSPVYLQWLKTSGAMRGNLKALDGETDKIGLRSGVRTGKRMLRTVAGKLPPWAAALGYLKRRRVENLLRASADPD